MGERARAVRVRREACQIECLDETAGLSLEPVCSPERQSLVMKPSVERRAWSEIWEIEVLIVELLKVVTMRL